MIDRSDSRSRDDCALLAEYRVCDEWRLAAVRNVSANGLFLETNLPPRVGDYIEVRIEAAPRPVFLHGCVMWRGQRADGVPGFRIEFQKFPPEYAPILERAERGLDAPDRGAVRRVAKRIRSCIPVAIQHREMLDDGFIVDISQSGARLVGTGLSIPVGSNVTLMMVFQAQAESIEVEATVVRCISLSGFAVQFASMTPQLWERVELMLKSNEVGSRLTSILK